MTGAGRSITCNMACRDSLVRGVNLRTSVLLLAGAIVFAGASEARAQLGRPLDGRLIFSVNGLLQPGSQDVDRTSTFTLYDEPAEIRSTQKVDGGGLFEVGATYRVRNNLGVGVSYTSLSRTSDGEISGSLPHPLFFDAPRQFSAPVPGLRHKQQAVHLSAVYYMPFVENVDLAFSAGPSFFTVSQGFARGVSFSENFPDFNTVTIDAIDTATLEESAVGFHLGADGLYAFTENIGAGLQLRYTRATANFDISDGQSAEVTAGGFQIGVGLRLRF
jgi:opacity protein-like surface antigen